MRNTKYLILTALFIALGIVLPFLTGQIPEIGSMLLPMHLPVLICGFLCGWPYGLAAGVITPMLRSLLFGMPPLFPKAVAMAFELAAYGVLAGLLYRLLPLKNTARIYLGLVGAMLGGRIVYGLVCIPLMGIAKMPYSFAIFFTSAFTEALPGIVMQLLLIPALLFALQRAHLIEEN